MSDNLTLRERAGQCLLVGVEGTALSPVEKSWLRLVQPAGIILFARNIESPEQTRELLGEAAAQVRTPLLTCVDLEGGTVDRLRGALAPMPSAEGVAAVRNPKAARLHGKLIGEACALFGFNVTFAPVLDLALPASRTVLSTRAISANPVEVVAYAKQFLDGLEQTGTLGCGKHFPGLGGGTLDSHLHLPRIARTWQELEKEDMAPFRALRRDLPMVMVSHAAYPMVTGEDEPASLSPFWARKALRKTTGFKGVAVSDDLEMQPVLSRGIENAAPQTVMAGCDMALICHRAELILSGYESVLRSAEHAWAVRDRVSEASDAVLRMKRGSKNVLRAKPEAGAAEKLRGRIAAFSAELQRDRDRIARGSIVEDARQKA